jgi:hypothetical protein
MIDDFLCKCGHRNKMHIPKDDVEFYFYDNNQGRICVEYSDCVNVKGAYYHSSEKICNCNDFIGDNLKYLESKI